MVEVIAKYTGPVAVAANSSVTLFGDVDIGECSDLTTTVTNSGEAAITVEWKRSSSRDQETVVLSDVTTTLAPGESAEVELNRNSGKVFDLVAVNETVGDGEIIASMRGVRL